MPRFPDPRAARRRRRATPGRPPRVVVLGDLVLDVVLAPARPLERGTDVPGRTMLRQGGSAATTARWLGRLRAPVTFVCAVGRDGPGRALVAALEADGVRVQATHVAGARTGRIGVLVDPGGERSFVADRGAADRLRPGDLRPSWFAGAAALHLPAYSLLTRPLGEAALAAIEIARGAGALVTLDLASIGPLLEGGRRAAAELVARVAPDVLFATSSEAAALLGVGRQEGGMLGLAPIAIIKRGAQGATVLARDGRAALRFEVATTPLVVADTTGAGDAFDAGFLAAWLDARARGVAPAAALQRAAFAGNRLAARHLGAPPAELAFAG